MTQYYKRNSTIDFRLMAPNLQPRHLGWRARYAYPNFFVVPANMVPFDMTLAQQRLAMLVEFEVDSRPPSKRCCTPRTKRGKRAWASPKSQAK